MKAERNHARLYRSSDDVVIDRCVRRSSRLLGLRRESAAGDAAPGTGRRFVDLGLYPVVDRRTQRSQTARREFPVGRIRDSPETARGKGCVFPICGPDPVIEI